MVAFIGVLLAVVLGWLVARTALVPLDSLTDAVEDVAETTDVSRRLTPGGPDELGRLRRTFNRLLEALESSRHAQSQLVLDASHELRTPLTSLRTNLEVIRRVDELSAEDRSVLVDDVLVQLQELTDLVGDLAELARGDQEPAAGNRCGSTSSCRPGGGAEHPRADEGRAVRPPGRAVLGVGPCRQARRAVGNLLDNARKWSPPGQPVSVECRDGTVVVHDHGPGIAEADLPHIFDRFYRSRPPGACPAPVSAWPSWPRSSQAEGGTIVAENDPPEGPA